ncbi:hypothetical protein D3C71_2246190 [compost metagenome]
MAAEQPGNLQGQPVRAANMTGEHADDMFSALVNDDDRGIGSFILEQRSYEPNCST